MVQPPSQPTASNANNDIQLRAATTDTLQYLATRVGELVEAKVIKVSHQLINEKATLEIGKQMHVNVHSMEYV